MCGLTCLLGSATPPSQEMRPPASPQMFWDPIAPCGLQVCTNRPSLFPGRMLYKATKPGLVISLILACFNCIVAYQGPFLCIVNFRWYVFCVLVFRVKVVITCQLIGQKDPVRKPNCGEWIISIKPRLKRAYDCVGLLYSFVVLLHDICVLPGPM